VQPARAVLGRDCCGADADASERSVIESEHYRLMGAMPRDRKGRPRPIGQARHSRILLGRRRSR
jgi:hypothetical protein